MMIVFNLAGIGGVGAEHLGPTKSDPREYQPGN